MITTFKPKNHFIFDRPLLTGILIYLGLLICGGFLYHIISTLPLSPVVQAVLNLAAFAIPALLLGLGVKALIKKGFVLGFTSHKLGKCIQFGALFVLQAAFIVCLHLITGRPVNLDSQIVFGAVCAAAAPGFVEELLFRGIVLNNMMRVWAKTPSGLYKALIISSLFFGLSHISNILLAGKLTAAILWQIGYAASFGILFGAIYLRTRNLWGCIFLHTLTDFVPYLFSMGLTQNIKSAAATASIVSQTSVHPIVMIYCSILIFSCLAIGFYLVRPQKHAEIRACWNLKEMERKYLIPFREFHHKPDWNILLK